MNDDRFDNPYEGNNPYRGFKADPVTPSDTPHRDSFNNIDYSTPVNIDNPPYQVPVVPPYNQQASRVYNAPVQNTQPQPQPQPQYSCEWHGGSNTNPASYVAPPYKQPQQSSDKTSASRRNGTPLGLFFAGIAVCLCLSFAAGFAGTWYYNYKFAGTVSDTETDSDSNITVNKVESADSATSYTDSGLSTVDIVSKTADSVVEITTETVTTGIFAQQFISSGAGSGVIIDSKGYIVTNHHVIDGATKISVTLRDGTSYDADLLGTDAELDIALLEIQPDDTLTAAVFGDSDTLMVGQRTVAIGNPLGQLGGSVTEGIISALNRDVVIDGQTMSLLQTDTAINPGNSGGGLFDSYGNLIGIVNAKSSGSEIEGLGFAIPINNVINILGDLEQYGYVRGRIDPGMTFIDVDSEQLAWMYGLKKTGCYIYSVDNNSNADIAGFASGDRVISVNGTNITKSEEVESILKDCAVGEEVDFKVENTAGKIYVISFELQEYVPDSQGDNFFSGNNYQNDSSYWWSYSE